MSIEDVEMLDRDLMDPLASDISTNCNYIVDEVLSSARASAVPLHTVMLVVAWNDEAGAMQVMPTFALLDDGVLPGVALALRAIAEKLERGEVVAAVQVDENAVGKS
jgi:hypothetical protein